MPDLKTALYAYLFSNGAIVGQVGQRIYPTIAPSSAQLPYIVFNRFGFLQHGHLSGQANLYESPLQFDIWGSSSLQAENVFTALQSEIDGFQGMWGGVLIRVARISSALDGLEEPRDGKEDGDYRITVNVDVTYKV